MEVTSYAPGTPSWVDLGTPDGAAGAAFYSGLFGWEINEGPPEAGGYRMCMFNGHAVAGMGPQMNPDMPPFWTTYVSVADADETTAAVEANGGQVLVPPMDVMDVGRMAIYMDPNGAAISAWQPRAHIGAGLVNEPGTLCWNELATRDTEVAATFYTAVFGWGTDVTDMGDFAYTSFTVNDNMVAGMMPMGEMFPPEVPSHWAVYFAVADCDASAAQVTELGGVVQSPPMDIPGVGRFAVCQDPQGAMFALMTMAPSES
jgi:predicted enzyme related to lactoylglutathione lyase